jgi:hypothetical protein
MLKLRKWLKFCQNKPQRDVKMEPEFDEQKYNNDGLNTLNAVSQSIGFDETSWSYFVAALIEQGKLNSPRFKAAQAILTAKANLEAERQRVANAREAELKAAFNDPTAAFPRLFNRRNGNPNELDQWLAKTPIADLEKLLAQLRGNPQHWSSLYRGISDAISVLDAAIAKRKVGGSKAK